MSRRRDSDGRRGVFVFAAALAVFVTALAFSSSSAYGAKAPKKAKPKVKASVYRGALEILGTAGNDRITLRLKPGNASRFQVDVGSNGYAEYTLKRSRFSGIVIRGRAGADAITLDESYGAFRKATSVYGDAGSDLVIGKGSNAADKFDFAAEGSRLKYSRNGSAVRIAGVERFDLRAVGGADDVVVNHLVPTGLAKLNLDPAAGSDRVTVRGSAGNDALNVAPAVVASRIAVSGSTPIDVVNSEALTIEALAGNDTLSGAVGLATLTQMTLDGGAGNDALNGGDGNDMLLGGSENDAVDGNRGDDVGLLAAGDDSFTWDPGDGSDKVEGDAGSDTMVFNGAGVAENFDLSANGNRLRFFRNVANITMDVDDTELVDLRALGGIDNTVVNDLSATDVKSVAVDLATDGAVDTTTVNGTAGNDTIAIAPNAGAVEVSGLTAAVKIAGSEAANDVLNVNGLDGNDTISGAVGLAALIKLGIDGGAGNDAINGGDGVETLLGGDGNDAIDGNQGNDTGFLGAGDDSFRWDPGDGSDVVEGQAGTDTMVFNGSGGAENFAFSAVGPRLRFTRNLGNIVMDVDDTERVDLRALGGNDNVLVNDLTGTDVTEADIDLAAAIGGVTGDGVGDVVTVNGTDGADDIAAAANAGIVDVTGLFTAIGISHSEVANDTLVINGLGGDDDVAIGGGVAALIQPLVDLGSDG